VSEEVDVRDVFTGTESDQNLPDTLYHYTDINGLKGIWEEGNLWATGFRYLNDTSELRLGMALVQSRVATRQAAVLEETLETSMVNPPAFDAHLHSWEGAFRGEQVRVSRFLAK
jgi:hypothetical protein